MCTLQARMQCYDRFSEVIPNEVEYNELILENAVSQLLLGFFRRGDGGCEYLFFSSRANGTATLFYPNTSPMW